MKRTHLITPCSVLLTLGMVAVPKVAAGEALAAGSRPNIILIMADDLGYGDLGCYGTTDIATPHIDSLADRGMKFTAHYVLSPVCTPTRASLMTGSYPPRVGLAQGVIRPDETRGIHPDEITIAELMQSAGYVTGCIGKWHLGFLEPFQPNQQGFDFYYGLWHNLDRERRYYDEADGGIPMMRNGEIDHRPIDVTQVTRLYTEEAVAFIKRHHDEPFFLFIPHTMPHIPAVSSKEFAGRSGRGPYGDSIEEMDWSTGQILKTLDALDLTDRTIVIFTSDDGPSMDDLGSAGPLRGTKHTTYEGGMRVPCVMAGPGIGKGFTDEPTTVMDFYVSLPILAGVQLPEEDPRVIDGRDIRPLMQNDPQARSPHEAIFFYQGANLQGVRSGIWKLLWERGQWRLYHLGRDIGETTDLADQHPVIVRRLEALMERHARDIEQNSRPAGGHQARR